MIVAASADSERVRRFLEIGRVAELLAGRDDDALVMQPQRGECQRSYSSNACLRMQFSAAKYSFRASRSWSTVPVT